MKKLLPILLLFAACMAHAQQRDTIYIDRGNGSIEIATVNPKAGLSGKVRSDSTAAVAQRMRDSLNNLARFARQEQRLRDSTRTDSLAQAFTAAMVRLRLIQDSLGRTTDSSDIVMITSNDSLRRAFTQWKIDSAARYAAIYTKIRQDSTGLAALISGNSGAMAALMARYLADSALNAAARHTHSNKAALDAVSGVNTGDQDLSGLETIPAHNASISNYTPTTALNALLGGYITQAQYNALIARYTADSAANAAVRHTHANKTALDAVTGINTGDETAATIRSKLGITTISGNNTGDQDLSPYQTIAAMAAYSTTSAMNAAITGALSPYSTTSAVTALLANYLTNATAAATYTTKAQRNTDSTSFKQSDLALAASIASVGDSMRVLDGNTGAIVYKKWRHVMFTVTPNAATYTIDLTKYGFAYVNPVQLTPGITGGTTSSVVWPSQKSLTNTSLVIELRGAVLATVAGYLTNFTGVSVNVYLEGWAN